MAEQLNLQFLTVPTEDAILRAPTYVNSCQIVGDANGHTLYFFATPPDAVQLPKVKAQHDAVQATGAPVLYPMEPLAKLIISSAFLAQLAELLAKQVKTVSDFRAVMERLSKGGKQ